MTASATETVLRDGEQKSKSRALSDGARFALLVAAIVVLAATAFCSLFVGSRGLDPAVVMAALLHPDGSPEHVVIQNLRIPRTALGVLVGAALGVGGALIQAFTRNPLADPGILGVNAGAGFAIVLGSAVFGVTSVALYLPFAFAGAIATTLVVYGIARRGGGGATPLRLTLVGIALAAVLNGISSTLALMDPDTFDRLRYWGAGTIADRPDGTIQAVAPFIVAGLVMALLLARSLNVFALGDELAQSLGARVNTVRILTIVAVTLLCGAATAAAGPIAFIGLMVPHAVRWLTGPDQRWILPFSLVLAPVLLLISDMLGRLVVYPGELQVGIVAAFLGAPVLIFLVRRTRGSAL
ncbi:iron chelate uptake ABC transporter family permease subunit [Pseudoclavibacter sp. AY1F1]|uniref:iron chelate uptake ABC transporter family permease subunit n=1 Tax=Pseudoclavibacter sp. AY1F1 TaxID=2080583 RepID=UPI0015E40C31|nr:iron chelate uptake ABC transporter family permease subunit [Pseudoclavibacter sp. AY1F1]